MYQCTLGEMNFSGHCFADSGWKIKQKNCFTHQRELAAFSMKMKKLSSAFGDQEALTQRNERLCFINKDTLP